MQRILLKHLAAFIGAVVFGVLIAVALVEAFAPFQASPGFYPRPLGVAIYAAWTAVGVYLAATGVLAFRRRCQEKSDPLDVSGPSFLVALVVVSGLALVVGFTQ
jgi:hypothetical protein